MDYEYTQCLNPILAELPLSFSQPIFSYQNSENNKLKIIGNLRHLSKIYNNHDIIELMSNERIIKLPCRKCINCALKKSKEWSTRNSLESREYDPVECWFITLTYDDDNLFCFKKNIPSLSKVQLSNFIKSLRAKFNNDNIRFFASGEYGSKTMRPHYHLLIYGLHLKNSDLEFLFSKRGFNYYKCETIEKIWKKGICVVCNFDEHEAIYVSQYTTKKIYEFKNPYFYECNFMQPTFVNMSRRPGIAHNYYEKHKDEFYVKNNDTLIFHQDFKTVHVKPFTFFDNKYDVESPSMMSFLKKNRRIFARQNDYFSRVDLAIPVYQFLNDTERKVKKCKERSRDYEES